MASQKSKDYIVILALWLMVFSASSQVMIMSPILPRIGEALTVPTALQSTLITSYALMLSLFALIIGPISDKVGRRRILLLGTGIMAIVLFLHQFVFDYWTLLIARGVAGGAGGLLSGAAVSYVGDYFPYERRGWANGWVMSGIAFGQVLGIPLGTFLADLYDFRTPFLIFGATMIFSFFLILYGVPQPNVQRDTERVTIPMMFRKYADLLRLPTVRASAWIFLFMFFSMLLFVIYLPTWIEVTLNVSGQEIATMFLIGGIASVIFSPQVGKLSDRIGRKPLIISSCIGIAILMSVTTFIITAIWIAYVVFFVAMILIVMRMSPLQALLTALVPAERRGSLLSMTVAIGQIGSALASAVAGILYTDYGFISNTVLAALAILVMGWLVWKRLPEPDLKPATA